MLYEIKNKYYIRVGRKYVNVEVSVVDNEVVLKSNPSEYIEINENVKAKGFAFDETFKKEFLKKEEKQHDIEEREEKRKYR